MVPSGGYRARSPGRLMESRMPSFSHAARMSARVTVPPSEERLHRSGGNRRQASTRAGTTTVPSHVLAVPHRGQTKNGEPVVRHPSSVIVWSQVGQAIAGLLGRPWVGSVNPRFVGVPGRAGDVPAGGL